MYQNFKKKLGRYWQLYVFLLFPLIYTIVFNYIPMTGVILAFKKFDFNKGIWGSPWVGFYHFEKFFNSAMFTRVLTNTFRISFLGLIISFPFPIIFALFLNSVENLKLKKAVQTITYMPHFISVVVLVGMLLQIFNPQVGLFGIMYKSWFGSAPKDVIGNPNSFLWLYIGSGIWQTFGWGSILYIATLTGINPELNEAAEIDGATRFQRVINIEFPALIPICVIQLILRAGQLLTVGFQKIYLMQNDLNLRTSEVISTYVYKRSLGAAGGSSDFAFGTAVGLFNSVVGLIMIVAVNKIASKFGDSSLW